MKPILGLLGVLLAALTVEFNDLVTSISLADVSGGIGIGHDPETWLVCLYAIGQVIGMTQSTWWAVTISIKRFALLAIALSCAASIAIPLSSSLWQIYVWRFIGGVAAGLTIPLLLTVALQVLKPSIRLYGLAAYALTATFGPNVATALAALWTEQLDWRFVFFQDIPLCAISGGLVLYGLTPTAPRHERLRLYDWKGTILVIAGFGSLTTILEQGDRYDWFNSPLICTLALVTAAALPLLLLNERSAPSPLFRFYLLKSRNVIYALLALFTFLIINLSATTLPNNFLIQVDGFRALQSYQVTGLIACLQFAVLPLVAIILNVRQIDSRLVSAVGLIFVMVACTGNSFLTSDWNVQQFLIWQVLQAVGGPMIIVALLMMATNTIKKPEDGLYGSTLVNTTRGLAEPCGVWLLQLIAHWRGAFHYNRLADQAGNSAPLFSGNPDQSRELTRVVAQQADVLALSDAFLVFATIAGALLCVLVILPVRTYPPRILFAKT